MAPWIKSEQIRDGEVRSEDIEDWWVRLVDLHPEVIALLWWWSWGWWLPLKTIIWTYVINSLEQMAVHWGIRVEWELQIEWELILES